MRERIRPAAASLPLLVVLAAACGHAGHHAPPGPPPTPIFLEQEPNDRVDAADDFGALYGGRHFIIEGHVQAYGPDQLDGFRFVAAEPLWVEFTLEGFAPWADPDLCVYDPWLDAYVACYDGPGAFEHGTLEIAPGTEFHLVVEAFGVDTPYRLEIATSRLVYASSARLAPAAADPDAAPAEAPPRAGSRRDAYLGSAAPAEATERTLARGAWIEIAVDGELCSLRWELVAPGAGDR